MVRARRGHFAIYGAPITSACLSALCWAAKSSRNWLFTSVISGTFGIAHRSARPLPMIPAASPAAMRFSDDDVGELIEQAATAQDLKPDWPPDVPTGWMSAFLAEEIATLQNHGVERFAFYLIP